MLAVQSCRMMDYVNIVFSLCLIVNIHLIFIEVMILFDFTRELTFSVFVSWSLVLLYYSYVPTHLHQMVFELVKNSLRAVQERFMDSDDIAPPVRIIVADGLEDVTIKVCASLSSSGQIL